jgi:hypothetical protein
MATRTFLVLGIAATTAACSVLIDVDGKQCDVSQDCAARGFPGSECRENLCVALVDEPVGGAGGDAGASSEAGQGGDGPPGGGDPLMCDVTTPEPGATVKFTFAPLFASPPEEPTPFSIKACQQFDLDCKTPLFGPIDVEAGVAEDFEVPAGFIGYFDITNVATLHGLYFMGRAVNVDTGGWPVRMPDAQTVQNLGFFAQQDVDPNLGIVLSVARSCEQIRSGDTLMPPKPLQGVTFSSSAGGNVFYIVNDLPNVNTMVTGPQGAAGFVNVPIGTSVLNVKTEAGQELKPVTVRLPGPNTISFVEVFP